MTGYMPIRIPTKKYIRAYVVAQLGDQPLMNGEHRIGSKLYDVLNHGTNEERTRFANQKYNATMQVYVSYHTFRKRGANLNETNIKNFNRFLEREIKERFYFLMDFYIDLLPNFSANLPEVRRRLGIDIFHWEDDTMQKDYYRYRVREGKPLLYSK